MPHLSATTTTTAMDLLTIFSYLLVLLLTHSFIQFRRSLHAAKQTGLPYICRPLFQQGTIYILCTPVFQFVIDHLPARLARALDPSDYLGFYRHDWRFAAKYEKHRALGDLFLVVSPGVLFLEVADPEVCAQVTDRRLDFVKNSAIYSVLRVFGRNIIEAEGETWRRHRRAITPQYIDVIHPFVWDQATILAKEMLSEWRRLADTDTDAAIEAPYTSRESKDLETLAHRVVMAAAFGVSLSFRTGLSPEAVEVSGLADSMKVVIANIDFVLVVPRPLWPLAPHISRAAEHVNSCLARLMNRNIRQQDQRSGPPTKANILDGLTKALAPPGAVPIEDQLSPSDVTGNIFALATAGSSTTADTIHFSMILLALHPDVQLWVTEELDRVVAEHGQEWEYRQVFPKLVRLSCLMMETLRLFPPVVMIPKCVESAPQTLTYNHRTITLPPHTMIGLSACALHHNPHVWGADAAAFRPPRWLSADSASLRPEPADGGFVGFSRGARKCLGKRFAEAEHAAVLAEVLRTCRIELVPEPEGPGETALQRARERAEACLQGSASHLTLHVGGRVPLRFVDRV